MANTLIIKHSNAAFLHRDEIADGHCETATIRQVKSEWTKAIAHTFFDLIDDHPRRLALFGAGFNLNVPWHAEVWTPRIEH